MKWHTLCLNNYTLLGIMKSTPIFSMLRHNTKICIRLFTCTEIFADTHMLLKLHFTVMYFFTTVNKSVQHIYMGLKKKFLQKTVN